MKDDVRKFLTAAERLAIETRVKSAESGSSGEIVVMAVSASNHYHAAILAASGTLALILAIGVMLLLGSENLWLFLPIFALLFVVAHELFKRVRRLIRPFVDRREMSEAVEEASIRAFYHGKVHETRHRAGILIYISLFERSVRVLADTGIDSKAGPEAWQEIVALVTKGIERGTQGEAIIEAVDRCSGLLSRHFPGRDERLNELGDAVILGSPEY